MEVVTFTTSGWVMRVFKIVYITLNKKLIMKEEKSIILRKLLIAIVMLFILSSLNISLWSQNKQEIRGIVTDAMTSEALIGVSVAEKGTTNGTLTDLDGNYNINVSDGATLVFTYIGYNTYEQTANGSVLDVALKPSQQLLDEVVVVGYGVQKKSVVTAAISSVKGEDLGAVMPTRVDNVLKGMVSGVNITQASGQPGEGSKVRIRGAGTINNSDPLYIVDGMAIGGGIDYLNPADIESVEVLKDAASAAIYGSRAANGVILVTTKGGKSGKVRVNYNFSYGWQNPWKKRSVLDATEYAVLINEMLANDGSHPRYTDPYSYGKGTDWQDEVFNYDAPVKEHQFSISGGNDKGSYYLSFGIFEHEGIVGGNFNRSNYDRKSLRFNNNYTIFNEKDSRKFFRTFKIGTSMAYSRVKSTGIETNSEFGSPLGSALFLSPILTVYDQNPTETLQKYPNAVTDKNGNVYTIVGSEYNEITNPLASLSLPGSVGNSDKIVANFWGELEIYKNLKFKSSYGVDLAFWGSDGHRIPYYLSQTNSNDQSSVWSSMNRGFTWQVENVLSYNINIQDHDFTFLVGQSAQSYRSRTLGATSYGLKDLTRPNIDLTTQESTSRTANGNMSQPDRLASYFGRLSYNYQERYMAEFTVRRDGSSNFGLNNIWATFPSFSLGWNITNEKFMEKRPEFLSSLKLRASWGRNGNQNIARNRYRQVMQGGNDYTLINEKGEVIIMPGDKPNGYPNPDIKWEESEQTDLGFDAHMLNGALTFTFDWYKKRTKGMLMDMPLPEYIGDTRPLGNVGTMDNSGVEFDLGYRLRVSDVNLRFNANATYLKNKVVKLGNETGWQNYDSVHSIGTITRAANDEPFPYFYGKRTNGIFQNQNEINDYVDSNGDLIQPKAKPGDVRFVDINGDGKIDDEDRTKLGKGTPDWTFGFNIGADWKGFDLNIQLNGSLGSDIYDASRRPDMKYPNLPEYMLGRWIGEGTSNKIPRLTSNDENGNWQSSDLYVKNGNYLRVRNVQLGYTLPLSLTRKAFVEKLRVYVNAENLLTFTSYDGFDPEISSGGTSLGIDKGVYPQARTISLGASITF